MPVFQVRQVVTNIKTGHKIEKITEIMGRDLRHAVECVRAPAPMKHDLQKKYWSRTIDPQGRELYIEIIDDKSRSNRGMR